MATKTALITGITGQDGSHLADLLLEKDYIVYGVSRRTANDNLQRIRHILGNKNFHLLYGDITDMSSLINALETSQPDEFYNLAAQSFVGESWNQPILTSNATGMGVLNCLEAIRLINKNIRFYQAGSSEMFGGLYDGNTSLNEQCRFHPRSPYGVAKVFAHHMTKNYRESYGMFCCNGILFNHEGERRGVEFVTRKITKGVANIYNEMQLASLSGNETITPISLGNLDVSRDWGYAKDYVEAMWLMLQQEKPDDYVIATGETHTLEEFIKEAFLVIGIENWQDYIKQDPKFMRPAEVHVLLGDSSKAKEKLGWQPKTSFKELVNLMVKKDIMS